jgi:hypothetical protein
MRLGFLAAIAVLVVVLGVPAVAPAQDSIRVQGRIQAVDCQNPTLVLSTGGQTRTWPVPPTAALFAGSAPIGLCTLQQYVGSAATVVIAAVDSRFVVGRVDVLVGATPPPPPYYAYPYAYPYPYPYYYPYPAYYYGPAIGIGIVFGGGFHHFR